MSFESTIKAEFDGADMQSLVKPNAKLAMKVGSVFVPKLDLSIVAHGERARLHPNSIRMLLSDDVTILERERIKGVGSWNHILEPLLTKHVSEALVHEVTKICATVNMIPGQFLLRQGLPAKSIFIVVSGAFRLISLGAPGIEPLDSSRANSARRSFSARQEAQTFGALIDPPKSSRPSASFASEVPVFRVASVGPGQLLGEECFSAHKIIQFSVMSESYATVLSVPIDSLLPMLSNERRSALSAMCLGTLALRAQRGVVGGSWYHSRKMELQNLKFVDQPIELVGTALQHVSKTTKHSDPGTIEEKLDSAPLVNSSAPAYPISTNAERQKVVQEQLMVCVVSASANLEKLPTNSMNLDEGFSGRGDLEFVDASQAVALESPALCSRTTANPSASGTVKNANPSGRPWASHRQHTARCSHSLALGQYVQPSQSQSGHSADMLLSRNLIIKNMYEQLQEAERSKQIRLKPKQGDQLSLKNALNMVGRQANIIAQKSTPALMHTEHSRMPLKGSIIHAHLQKLFVSTQPPTIIELASVAKGTPLSSCPQSSSGRAAQSQESARSRPYNSNFSYLFESKDAGSPPHPEIFTKNISTKDQNHSSAWALTHESLSQSTERLPPKSTSNILMVQPPHPPATDASEHSSATLNTKRRKYAVISTADFNPLKDADLTVRSLPTRPQSHKSIAPNRTFFEKHAAGSPKKFTSSFVSLSDAKTEPKEVREQDPHLFIGSKIANEGLQSHSKSTTKNSARIKGAHSVVFQLDQDGPSLDRDLEHDQNLSFSMSPWKSGS